MARPCYGSRLRLYGLPKTEPVHDTPLSSLLDEVAVEYIRERSKVLYGNRHRLEVVVAIARTSGPFYQRELSNVTGIPDSQIKAVLEPLADAGLVRAITGNRGMAKYYERMPSVYWQGAEDLLDEVTAAALRR